MSRDITKRCVVDTYFFVLSQLVRGQTPHSLLLHNITYCKEHYLEWEKATQCPLPQFSGNKPVVRVMFVFCF